MIEILNFPMPPSANVLYLTLPNRRRCKTKEYLAFEKRADEWMARNAHLLNYYREYCKKVGAMQALSIDVVFLFHRSSIITKANRPKRKDTSNYLKSLFDVLAKILDIDDSLFWNGTFLKGQTLNEKESESCQIQISIIDILQPDASIVKMDKVSIS